MDSRSPFGRLGLSLEGQGQCARLGENRPEDRRGHRLREGIGDGGGPPFDPEELGTPLITPFCSPILQLGK